MRAFPGVFVVMTIVGADRALEVCSSLSLCRAFLLSPCDSGDA